MSLSLLHHNICRSCNLNFQSMYDLIAHIEIDHIPAIEADEERRKEEDVNGVGRGVNNANLPLSYYYKIFPHPHKPVPCAPETVKVSFCHYRKRSSQVLNDSTSSTSNASQRGRKEDSRRGLDEDEHSVPIEDLEEADPSDPDVSDRFRCQIRSCGKQFKNVHGVRNHMAVAHSAPPPSASTVTSDDLQGAVVTAEGTQLSNARQGRPFKCSHCSKRYKSQNGLTSHMTKEHIKTDISRGNESPSSAPMSPAAFHEQKPQIGGGMRPVASQPQLSSMQQGQQYQQGVAIPNHHSFVHSHNSTTHNPNVQVRQLTASEDHTSAHGRFQNHHQMYQMSDGTPAHPFHPTGAVLQAQLQQKKALAAAQGQLAAGNRAARSPAYVPPLPISSSSEFPSSSPHSYSSTPSHSTEYQSSPQRPLVPNYGGGNGSSN